MTPFQTSLPLYIVGDTGRRGNTVGANLSAFGPPEADCNLHARHHVALHKRGLMYGISPPDGKLIPSDRVTTFTRSTWTLCDGSVPYRHWIATRCCHGDGH